MATEETVDQPGKFGALENRCAEISLSEYTIYIEVIVIYTIYVTQYLM